MSNAYPDLGNYRLPPDEGPIKDIEDDINILLDGDGEPDYDENTNTTSVELDDGTVSISVGPPKSRERASKFDDNLAEKLSDGELDSLAEDLLRKIDLDDMSRQTWLENLSNAIGLLGLEIKNPRGAAASASTPNEGSSTIDHPLLLEAVLRFQATARGELLPTDGPVKVRIDGESDEWIHELAAALQKDLNHYLTKVATEYYPDTDRMLFQFGFCGTAFKKGYHCPLKRRPVIESIDAKDLIVSNASTNLEGSGRVTHRIFMRNSLVKRMQLVGAYRDIDLIDTGSLYTKNAVDQRIDRIQGVSPRTSMEPGDQDREIYECYCEIEVPGFEHKDKNGEETGLPLPYKVSIDKESRKVLEIRKNWEEDDELCMPKNRIVAYIFVPGLGFYGIGLLNILGNATKAVTAAWRLMIDAGMFANFPGFLYIKSLAKQLTNQFRVPPGGGLPIDTLGQPINQAVMPLPYKDPSPVFIQLIENITQTAQRVGDTTEMSIGEGRQDAPVGTTLALIEQAVKMMSEVHKRAHESQSKEFAMLKELLKEDPGALWRHNKKSKVLRAILSRMGQQSVLDAEDNAEKKHIEMFLLALENCELEPMADPNTSSQTERYLKLSAAKQIQLSNPNIDANAMDVRLLHALGFDDAESLFKPPTPMAAAPPDPRMLSGQAALIAAQAKQQEVAIKARDSQLDAQTEAADIAGKERIAQMGLQKEIIIHQRDRMDQLNEAKLGQQNDALDREHDMRMATMQHGHQMQQQGLAHQADLVQSNIDRQHERDLTGIEQQHQAQQEGIARKHEAQQANINRSHEMKTARIQAKRKPTNGSSKS